MPPSASRRWCSPLAPAAARRMRPWRPRRARPHRRTRARSSAAQRRAPNSASRRSKRGARAVTATPPSSARRRPTRFAMMPPERIYDALTTGVMQAQGAALTDVAEARRCGVHERPAARQRERRATATSMPNQCTSNPTARRSGRGAGLERLGQRTLSNTPLPDRARPPGLTAAAGAAA